MHRYFWALNHGIFVKCMDCCYSVVDAAASAAIFCWYSLFGDLCHGSCFYFSTFNYSFSRSLMPHVALLTSAAESCERWKKRRERNINIAIKSFLFFEKLMNQIDTKQNATDATDGRVFKRLNSSRLIS